MSDDSDQHDIDRRRFESYVDVVRRADRPRPPTAASRDRIEAKMWTAFSRAEAVERSDVDDPGEIADVVAIEAAVSDPQRPRRYRVLAAAAAVVLIVALGVILLVSRASDDRTILTTPPETGLQRGVFAAEVEQFCDAELPALQD